MKNKRFANYLEKKTLKKNGYGGIYGCLKNKEVSYTSGSVTIEDIRQWKEQLDAAGIEQRTWLPIFRLPINK